MNLLLLDIFCHFPYSSLPEVEIAAFSSVSKSPAALKPDFRQQPGKSDLIILTVDGTKFGAITFPTHIPVYAAMKIEMYLMPITSYPFRFPSNLREIFRHELLEYSSQMPLLYK